MAVEQMDRNGCNLIREEMDNVKDNEMHYYDLQRNWTLKIVPHLNNATLKAILVCDFSYYCVERWNKTFRPGQLPEDVDSCDWRVYPARRGPRPRYWTYVALGACHCIVNFSLCLALLAEPKRTWRIVTSEWHSTVWDGTKALFDFNYQALGISASECWRRARYGKNHEILMPGQQQVLHEPLPWFRNGKKLPVNTPVTLKEIKRRDRARLRF
jgi:hypothetical protein